MAAADAAASSLGGLGGGVGGDRKGSLQLLAAAVGGGMGEEFNVDDMLRSATPALK